jgi:PAS domain S-box-containing protein
MFVFNCPEQFMRDQLSPKVYKNLFYSSTSAQLIVDVDAPNFTILDVNNAYLNTTNAKRDAIIHKPVFEAFPDNPRDAASNNVALSAYSFSQVLKNKLPHTTSNYRYDLPIPGTDLFEERYWTTTNTPVLDDDGQVISILHTPVDVTAMVKLVGREKANLKALKDQRKQLYSTFMQAPVGIGIFKGEENIVELINPQLAEIYGVSQEVLIGKPVFNVLTHASGHGFEEKLEHVRKTGEAFKAQEVTVPLFRNGMQEDVYIDLVYEPFREEDGTITGVIAIAREITEQVQAKKRLEEAEERARLAVDSVGMGTFDLNLITGEMVTSDTFAKIHGFDAPVTRASYVSVFHKNDLEARAKAIDESMKSGVLFYEARINLKDGSIHWVRVEGKVYFESGIAVRILGVTLDITEQKQSRGEQKKLLSLVANSVDMMSILNLEGRHSYVNDAGRMLLGFMSDEQVRTTHVKALYSPEDYKMMKREVMPAMLRDGRWSGKMSVRNLITGESFEVFNNSIRIDDPESGRPIAIGAVVRDLRPEQASKQALERSEALLRSITTAAPTGLWQSDAEGNIIYVNQTWVDWTGIPFEAQLGQGWLKAVIEEDLPRLEDHFKAIFETREFFEIEYRIYHADGSVHWCVATGRPQYNGQGVFEGYIGAGIDITEQKYLQQQKDNFIGIASHELKTPVTSIKAYTQVLERVLRKNGSIKEAAMISKMDGQLNRLTSLIGDLLDVTKINSGRLQFNDRKFEFNTVVAELVEDLQRTTQNHVLKTAYSAPVEIFADEERIGQVITNLITNAIKYSPGTDRIDISTEIVGNEIKFCVKDYGIGLSKENLKKVFEQFYRVTGDMQHTFPGLGLGLFISAEIIRRAGGHIWVDSIEGAGATFCFTLPIRKEII